MLYVVQYVPVLVVVAARRLPAQGVFPRLTYVALAGWVGLLAARNVSALVVGPDGFS